VLRYIAGSIDYGLDYIKRDGVSLVGYTDSDWAGCATDRKSTLGCCFGLGSGLVSSDWAGCATDRKSTLGCCFGLGSGLVSWYNRKHKLVALSFAEAEYMATS
jgi:hypothetical protein